MIEKFKAFNESKEEKTDVSFIDLMLKYFVHEGKYKPYVNDRYQLIKEVHYWPSGLDPENFEIVDIKDDEVTVYSAGDWQEGMYVTLTMSNEDYIDEPGLSVVEAISVARAKGKFKKNKNTVKKWFKKYLDKK